MIKGKKIIVMFMMLGLGTASLVGCGKKENTADAKGDSAAASGQMVEGQMNYELTTTDNNRLADDGSSAVDNNDQQTDNGQNETDGKTDNGEISMYDLTKKIMESEDSLPAMTTVNSSASDANRLFACVSEMDYSKIDSFLLAYSTEGKADEIAVIKLKDEADINELIDSLKVHLKDRKGIYESYDTSQLSRVEDASLYSKGSYAVLIICDNKKNVKSVIDEAIAE